MNPELRRNIWLELSGARMVIAPITVMLVLLIGFKSDGANGVCTASWCLIVALSVWGGARTARSVVVEVQDNTWDFQRTSAMNAAEMTIGKLLGAPIFAAYASVIPLVAIFLYNLRRLGPVAALEICVSTILCILCINAVSLISSIEAGAKARELRRTSRVAMPFVPVLALLFGGPSLMSVFERWTRSSRFEVGIQWWGLTFNGSQFLLFSSLVFATWAVVGAYRLMRVELQFHTGPAVFSAFLLFLPLYMTPLAKFPELSSLQIFAMTLLGVGASLAYFLVLTERLGVVRLRKLVSVWRSGMIRDGFSRLPRFFVAACAAVCGALLIIVAGPLKGIDAVDQVLGSLSIVLFLVRDMSLVLGVFITPKGSRWNELAALFYLAILYIVLPILFKLFGLEILFGLFYPFTPKNNFLVSFPLALVGCGVTVVWFLHRFRVVVAKLS